MMYILYVTVLQLQQQKIHKYLLKMCFKLRLKLFELCLSINSLVFNLVCKKIVSFHKLHGYIFKSERH